MIHPVSQPLHGHDLSAEHHQPDRFRNPVLQSVKCADQAQRGDCPDHHRRLLFTQEVKQGRRRRKQRPRNKHQLRAAAHRAVDILYGNIKIKRRLVRDHIVLPDPKQADKNSNKVKNRAMADQNPLRNACRA